MTGRSRRRAWEGIAACTITGGSAALCELIRALTSDHPLSTAYAAWCMVLIVGGSAIVGLFTAALERVSSLLLFLPWLAVAGALLHGASGCLGFALAGVALGILASGSRPALLPWAAGIGAVFELSGSHANRFTHLIDAGVLTSDELAMGQQLVIFVPASLALTWLLGRGRARRAPLLATMIVLALSLSLSARDVWMAKPRKGPAIAAVKPALALEQGPSVLLLVLDTVRADHTSLYGYARRTTPNLESLLITRPGAQRFDLAFANGSWTVPAHASLLSGQLPSVHGADFTGRQEGEPMAVGIAPEVPMIAELLAKRGWDTFGIFANRWLGTAPGFRRGFRSFERVLQRVEVEPLGERIRELVAPGLRAGELTSYPDAVFVRERVLLRIEELGGARFFGLVNFMDAHGPHMPMPDVAGSFGPWSVFDESPQVLLANSAATNQRLMDRYDEQILHLDRNLGLLFEALERRGILERTWVIVVGDHGEAFGEHGVTDHGSAVYGEIVHVPLVVFPPRDAPLAPPESPASQVDVAATIAAIAGVDYRGPGRDLRTETGKSLVQIQHGAAPFRSAGCGEIAGKDARAVVEGHWKLLDIEGSLQLFDLEADPGETLDLAPGNPALVEQLRAKLPERMLHATPVGHEAHPTPSDEKRLRALGY
ncbi:MAG: sulfatase-like hydrolase/transferase [Planctomycetota bacterium]